ncbi:hypothetical protein BYT27DRAFT_6430745 [Phlegmacium glaucopus]|nr:hypothetical protein BYT27DRAFT_6430745 [Phlegmacium glaucopus]
MDPFVIILFGKVFRTRIRRHSRNPIWDEKLLFRARRYETAFQVQLIILDTPPLNDHIGDASFSVKYLVESAPQRDPVMETIPQLLTAMLSCAISTLRRLVTTFLPSVSQTVRYRQYQHNVTP